MEQKNPVIDNSPMSTLITKGRLNQALGDNPIGHIIRGHLNFDLSPLIIIQLFEICYGVCLSSC